MEQFISNGSIFFQKSISLHRNIYRAKTIKYDLWKSKILTSIIA